MSNKEYKEKTKELIFIFLLTLATGFFGINGFSLLMLIFPAFSIVAGVKYGLKYNLTNMILAVAVLSIIGGAGYILPLSIYIGLATILDLAIKRKERVSRTILAGGTYMLLILSTIFVVLKLFFEVDIVDALEISLRTGLNETIDQLSKAETSYDLASIKIAMEQSINFVISVFPVIMLIGSFIVSIASYGTSSYILNRKGIAKVDNLKLMDFRLSSKFSFSAVLIVIAVIAIRLMGLSIYESLALNLTTILYLLVFIQGLGVASYFLGKTKLNKFLKTIIIIFLAFNVALSMVVSFVGVLDIVLNFRKIRD